METDTDWWLCEWQGKGLRVKPLADKKFDL